MAMDAYELARPLDDDGLFHLSLLQRSANEYEYALATAVEGLEGNPDHLLNLSSAAEASLQLGQVVEGRAHYEHLLEIWDEEIAAGRQEYEEHAPLLPLIREDAEAFLSGGTAP
jgi:tetratricopeptide (TPR) repeat protein